MVVLISGKMGSGKTATTRTLLARLSGDGHQVYHKKFAGPLYEMHDAVLGILRAYGIERQLDKTLLQLLGTEYGRKTIGEDVWVNCLCNWYNDVRPKPSIVVVDDLRFKNEFTAFSDCLRVRLECPKEIRKARCEQWRDNDTHQSETDLDDWLDKFDLLYHTDTTPLDDVVGGIHAAILQRLGAGTR